MQLTKKNNKKKTSSRISNPFSVVTHFWTQLSPDPNLHLVWTERNAQEEADKLIKQ